MNCGPLLKKQEHLQPHDPDEYGDMWIWRAIDVPSRLRVVTHLSHERSESEARTFLGKFKARTDGRAPFLTSDQLPAYLKALVYTYSEPEPLPLKRSRGRPRQEPRRILDPELRYAQVDKVREGGRVIEVNRQLIFGTDGEVARLLHQTGCGATINTSYVERDNLTSRQSNGRLVRKTLSHSKTKHYLQRQLDLEDAIYKFVRPHQSLRVRCRKVKGTNRKWEKRTPAMAAGLIDHIWTLEELLAYRLPPSKR
jgi:IS1 family transposase